MIIPPQIFVCQALRDLIASNLLKCNETFQSKRKENASNHDDESCSKTSKISKIRKTNCVNTYKQNVFMLKKVIREIHLQVNPDPLYCLLQNMMCSCPAL